jgi:hypothetical protein
MVLNFSRFLVMLLPNVLCLYYYETDASLSCEHLYSKYAFEQKVIKSEWHEKPTTFIY